MLLPQEIIRRKRQGLALTTAEIAFLVEGITTGSVSDAQIAAFAMAVLWRGMDRDEAVALTLAMRDSGQVLRWDDLPGPVVDKHSTGGIGDKVSLILAPLLAACGCFVPLLSGRGLGHTGGTLDKLESIPGFDTRPDLGSLRRIVREAGCAIVGQTDDLAPADRRFYAIRDVTATVESVPLITASILAKKLAGGASALVMDVKVGSGAFLPDLAQAQELAGSIVSVAEGAGLRCNALLTGMDCCLGRTAGNALEVGEAIAMLRGDSVDGRLREVTLALTAEGLQLAGLAGSAQEAVSSAEKVLVSGAAAERFAAMVRSQGGPGDLLDRPEQIAGAPVRHPVHAEREGTVQAIDARRLGLAIAALGGGRRLPGDSIDHAVGLDLVLGIGEVADRARPLSIVHARDQGAAEHAAVLVRSAFVIGESPAMPSPPIIGRLPGRGSA